jgi:hypothetical protein
MEKYCIVPQKSNKCWQLVQDMTLSEKQAALLKGCFVRHVEVSPQDARWEILLETKELLEDALLDGASAHICKKNGLREVLFYQKVEDLSSVLENIWGRLTGKVTSDAPALRMLLRNAKKELKNGTLRVGLSSAMAATLIKNHSLAERLQKAIGEMTGCYCDVECEAYDGEMLELPDIEKTIYRMSAYKQAAKQEQVREANPEPKPK